MNTNLKQELNEKIFNNNFTSGSFEIYKEIVFYVVEAVFALAIEAEILFVRNEQKDCSEKPDP